VHFEQVLLTNAIGQQRKATLDE